MKGIVRDIIIVGGSVAVLWTAIAFGFGAWDNFLYSPFYVVASGSMYPELDMYDLIIISGHVLFEDVKVGDIIVFDRPKDHDRVIVHRVVAYVDDDPLTLRTKGDNNQNSIVGTDYPITEEEYKGTVIHVIPQVGYITKILQPPINYIIIVVIIGIMIIRQISKNYKKKHGTGIIKDGMEKGLEKLDKKLDVFTDGDSSWLDDYKNASKDFTIQEKKSTEKPEENTKEERDNLPAFFKERDAKESEEKK